MSFRYPAGLITASSPVNANYPSGVWTPRQALPYLQNGVWGQDTNFNQTVLLLHGDGTNGAQNNTFLDSSTNNFTITRNGNTTQGTFSPFSLAAGQWSNYFDGNGDFLSVAGSSNFNSTGDFTMEAWAYITSASAFGGIISLSEGTFGSGGRIAILNTGFLEFAILGSGGSGGGSYSGTAVPLNQWFHVALVRSGSSTNNCSAYLNGSRVGQFTSTSQVNTASNVCVIGRYYASGTNQYWATGYIASARYVVGTALYSGTTYTVPTTPLTAVSGTQLLTCQSNRFVDNSTNAFAITRNGDVRVTPFSPFTPTAAYSAGTNGGSGYFDGSGDYLSAPASSQFLPGVNTDFTFEAWVYLTATPGAQGAQIVGTGEYGTNSDWNISVNSSRVPSFYINVPPTGLSVTSSTAINLFSWNHIAVTRSGTGSNNLKMFLNGVNVGQTSTNITLDYTGNNLTLGADENGDEALLTGYISGLRLINGTGYTSITEPTSPPTAITNTSLLLNFTNAGIFDNTGKNVLETVGNAQIDTTTKKYGTGSMEFDGTGDRLVFPSTPDLQLGTGNFTIEGWVYRADTNIRGVFQLSGTAGGLQANATTNLALGSDTGAVWRIYANNSGYNSAATWSINTWYHFALVRNSGTTTLYINGTSVISQADTVNYTGQNLCVGGFYDTTYLMNGYIDDLRITKGIARYTANFVPPIARFPNQ